MPSIQGWSFQFTIGVYINWNNGSVPSGFSYVQPPIPQLASGWYWYIIAVSQFSCVLVGVVAKSVFVICD